MRGHAHAKLNLGLRVGSVRDDGLHSIVSLAQSIDWADTLSLEPAAVDRFEVEGADLPPREGNLAWRAVEAIRGGSSPALHMTLDKDISVAAGLGGGSADAALGLVLTTVLLGSLPKVAVSAAANLGADVPFCLAGGTAWLEGAGERVTPIPVVDDHWYAVVVPPFEMPTPAVYARWDRMDGPSGPEVDGRDLPVSLRALGPFRNDLLPAAIDLEPALGDWMADLRASWSQPVMMSGSGPALFGLFATESEAMEAADVAPGARATRATRPIGFGWQLEDAPGVPPAPWH